MRGEPREASGRSPPGSSLGFETSVGPFFDLFLQLLHPTSRELQAAAEVAPSLSSLLHAEVKPALGWGRHPLYLTARFGHLPGAKLPLHFEMPLQVPAKKEQLLRLPSALSSNSTACHLADECRELGLPWWWGWRGPAGGRGSCFWSCTLKSK